MRALAIICLPLAAAAAGCGSGASERQAKEVMARFAIALDVGDGPAACRELSAPTRAALEREEKQRCGKAILGLPLARDAAVLDTGVYSTAAIVRLAQGTTAFLDQAGSRWTISAAGCRADRAGRPYRCELED